MRSIPPATIRGLRGKNLCPAAAMGVDLKTASSRAEILQAIREAVPRCLTETRLDESVPGLGPKRRGKVRDVYETDDHLVIVTTDRMSAFDRVLASIPFKGQVLNQTSVWWFKNTRHITAVFDKVLGLE